MTQDRPTGFIRHIIPSSFSHNTDGRATKKPQPPRHGSNETDVSPIQSVPHGMTMSGSRRGLLRLPTTLLDKLFSKDGDDDNNNAGLIWLSIWQKDTALQDNNFDDVLHNVFIPRMLKSDHVKLVLQLRNNAPSNQYPYALLARHDHVPGINITSTDSLSSLLPRRGQIAGCGVGCDVRTYQLVQRYDGKQRGPKGARRHGRCLVAVTITPSELQQDEIDRWYREEYLHLVASTPMFVRSTRYKSVPGLVYNVSPATLLSSSSPSSASKAPMPAEHHQNGGQPSDTSVPAIPSMLALHEFTDTQALLDFAIKQGDIVKETPWSKKIFEEAKAVERTIWEVNARFGEGHGAGANAAKGDVL